MNFREMLELGALRAGDQKHLAALLELHPNNITNAKRAERGLPDEACAKLAQLIGLPWAQVQAARNEWLAKTDAERRFWHPFVMGRAAMIFASTALIGLTALPTESHAAQGFMTNARDTIGIM